MAALNLRRIQCGSDDAAGQLAGLRAQLGAQGNVVSARGRALTEKVFGEAVPPAFKNYAAQIIANARTLAHELEGRKFRLISGGTDTHLMLVDVTARGLTGKQAEQALDRAGITVNRNGIPFDTRPPLDPSGIRIGTPALTTRGMREPEMRQIGAWIGEVLAAPDAAALQERIRGQVRELGRQFPAPADAVV
jgi:glycine hydroxymethyltransferase